MHPTRAAVPFGSLPRYRADGFCKRATHPPPEATAKVEAVKPLLDASPDYQSVARLRLPAIYQWPESAEDGGLLAYGREGCCATGMLRASLTGRVLEIPTPRWTTIQAAQLGIAPPDVVAPTIQERAWSSSFRSAMLWASCGM
jgi:hypothetical protein